jgi:predicted ArsR family transcriptional regulator
MEQSTGRPACQTWETTITPAGMRIVKLLVGRAPQTVTELIRAAGVTRTAVTEQLNELVSAGFAERSYERLAGRGRPRHLYSATRAALLLLFAGNQGILVPAIWRAIAEVGGEGLRQRVCMCVAREMAEHYSRRIGGKKPSQRLSQLAELFREEGDVVEVTGSENGRLVMHRRSCGFFSMFEESRSVCRVDEEMIRRVVRAPVERTACRHDGDPCCQFAVSSKNGE